MTLDEAKQLKSGDRVLIEALVGSTLDSDNNVQIAAKCEVGVSVFPVSYEGIREKITPPRRKFRKGDIVAVKNEAIYYVTYDEQEGMKVYLSATGEDTWSIRLDASELTLVCAVEDRADRKEEEV